MTLAISSSDPNSPIFHVDDTCITAWQTIPQSDLSCHNSEVRGKTTAYTEKLAKHQMACDRQNELEPMLRRRVHPHNRLMLRVVAVLAGMITMSAGAQIITARLGPLSLPAALCMGGVLTWFSDGCGTRAHTNARRKQMTLAALNALAQKHQANPPINDLGQVDNKARVALVKSVEAEHLAKGFPTNGTIAMLLNGAEYAVNLWIISQLGLPGGLLLESAAALLPIGVQWAASVRESETCDLPEVAADLHYKYDAHHWERNQGEGGDIENYELERLDRILKFLPHGDPNGRFSNLDMVLADLDITYHTGRKNRLELEGIQAVKTRQAQLEKEKTSLRDRCPYQGTNLTEQQLEHRRNAWVKEQIPPLEEANEQDCNRIRGEYGIKIRQCEDEVTTAWECYQDAERRARHFYGEDELPKAS